MKEKYSGFMTIGTTAHDEAPIYSADLTSPLMLGNESYATSFNVSCAASILMYEITRQRGIKRSFY